MGLSGEGGEYAAPTLQDVQSRESCGGQDIARSDTMQMKHSEPVHHVGPAMPPIAFFDLLELDSRTAPTETL